MVYTAMMIEHAMAILAGTTIRFREVAARGRNEITYLFVLIYYCNAFPLVFTIGQEATRVLLGIPGAAHAALAARSAFQAKQQYLLETRSRLGSSRNDLTIMAGTASSSRTSSPAADSKLAFQAFIERLAESARDDPRLMSISLELEALNSIFEASCRLHNRSRPGSWHGGDRLSTENNSSSGDINGANEAEATQFTSLSAAIKSIPPVPPGSAFADEPRPVSAQSNISHLEELNTSIGPLDRLRYELVIPLFDETDREWVDAFPQGASGSPPTPPVVRILVRDADASDRTMRMVTLNPVRCMETGVTSANLSGVCTAATAATGSISWTVGTIPSD
jgi:hypothetical protein